MNRTLMTVVGLLLGLTWGAPEAAAQAKIRMAVVDFKSDMGDGAVISDVVRNEFLRTGVFELAERSALERVLKEQQLQMAGLLDSSAAVEVGRLAAAQKLVMGGIGTVGDQIVVTVRVVDVETGAVEIGDKQIAYSRSDLVPVVEDLTRRIASKIVGREIQVAGKTYFATALAFSEMKVLYIAGKDVTVSLGADRPKPGDRLVAYIVKPNGKEQRKALLKVRRVTDETIECREERRLEGMVTATDLVRRPNPGEFR